MDQTQPEEAAAPLRTEGHETSRDPTESAMASPKQGPFVSLKHASLFLLCTQNALLILVMRYVRTREGDMFMATTAVILTECFKVFTSVAVIFYMEHLSFSNLLRHLKENIIDQPMDCVKISVPSVIYTLQNNLLYLAVSNLEAATFQVTYQLKILTTALFSVLMLNKQLSRLQWGALVLLFIGVSTVQLQPNSGSAETVSTVQKPLVGLVAVIISCLMSGFAGVYFEKILKGTKQSIWLRNVQLGVLGIVVGTVTMLINDGEKVQEEGFFYGYDWVVMFVVVLQSFGGIMVAVVVKYADNILKGFATSAAIILSSVAAMYLFDFQLSLQFTIGAFLVIVSVYMYSKFELPVKISIAKV